MADPNDYDDLQGIDLGTVDLSDVSIDEPAASNVWRWVGLFMLTALGGVVLWLPNTDWYRLRGNDSTLFFLLTGSGIVVGVTLGRLLWRYVQIAAERWATAAEARLQKPPEPPKPPSALRRWLTLAMVVGGAAAILFGVPGGAYHAGGDAQAMWFVAAGGAFVVGILLGRWLLMQAAARELADTRPREPIRLPPWFKWVSLGILVALALFALLGRIFSNGLGGEFEFALGGVGFVVGVAGAIWMARRFDELERKAAVANEIVKSRPRSR